MVLLTLTLTPLIFAFHEELRTASPGAAQRQALLGNNGMGSQQKVL